MSCFALAVRQKVAVKLLGAGKTKELQRILFVTLLDLKLMLVAYTVGVTGLEGISHVCYNERLGERGLGEGD